jgi:ABC-type antimicrobial peptide transport system ATPase subunit
MKKNLQKLPQMAYNMKSCLRFSTCIFWILLNIAKYTYGSQNWKKLKKKKKKAKP